MFTRTAHRVLHRHIGLLPVCWWRAKRKKEEPCPPRAAVFGRFLGVLLARVCGRRDGNRSRDYPLLLLHIARKQSENLAPNPPVCLCVYVAAANAGNAEVSCTQDQNPFRTCAFSCILALHDANGMSLAVLASSIWCVDCNSRCSHVRNHAIPQKLRKLTAESGIQYFTHQEQHSGISGQGWRKKREEDENRSLSGALGVCMYRPYRPAGGAVLGSTSK